VTDEYQTYHFWNMKKSELREIIKEEIYRIVDEDIFSFNKKTIAQDAFKNAKEGDIFRMTTTNPSSKGHFGGTKGNTQTSQTYVVKQGNYFVEKDDLDKPEVGGREIRKREYLPKDLDKNNKELIMTKVGSLDETTDPISKALADKVGVKPTTAKNVMKEKEYEVEYWFRFGRDGDEKDNDIIKVMAPVKASDDEIIKKAKEEARRNYINSSFKVKR
jgi:hypothetical protein